MGAEKEKGDIVSGIITRALGLLAADALMAALALMGVSVGVAALISSLVLLLILVIYAIYPTASENAEAVTEETEGGDVTNWAETFAKHAKVRLPSSLRKATATEYSRRFLSAFDSSKLGFSDPETAEAFLRSTIAYESYGDGTLVNGSDYMGLMQINPESMRLASATLKKDPHSIMNDPHAYADAFAMYVKEFRPAWKAELLHPLSPLLAHLLPRVPTLQARELMAAHFVYCEGRAATTKSMMRGGPIAARRTVSSILWMHPGALAVVSSHSKLPLWLGRVTGAFASGATEPSDVVGPTEEDADAQPADE
jgi:hypothetical protein